MLPIYPHFSIEYLLIKPNKKPAANKSPAPVVSTSFTKLIGSTRYSSLFSKTTEPFEPRVMAPITTFFLGFQIFCGFFGIKILAWIVWPSDRPGR